MGASAKARLLVASLWNGAWLAASASPCEAHHPSVSGRRGEGGKVS